MFGLFKSSEADKLKAEKGRLEAELKQANALIARLRDMKGKYEDNFQRGRNKTTIVNVLQDIDAVIYGRK